MKIGVVLPVLNCLPYTVQAIESMHSDRHELTLVVIDNASTDGTAAYLRGLAFGRSVPMVLTQTRNLGVAASWNLGIEAALAVGADRVVVANNDIVCAPDAIDNLIAWTTPALPFVTATVIDGPLHHQLRPRATRHQLDFCLFALHPELLSRVGWFDEAYWPAYWEDRDYEMRMRQAHVRSANAMDVLVTHAGSRTIAEGGVKNFPYYALNKKRFLSKWPQARQTRLAR